MKAYHGFFKKKNGQMREMLFAELDSLPDDFLGSKIMGTGTPKTYSDGMELVWDLREQDFRVFNFNTVVGIIQEVEVSESDYLES